MRAGRETSPDPLALAAAEASEPASTAWSSQATLRRLKIRRRSALRTQAAHVASQPNEERAKCYHGAGQARMNICRSFTSLPLVRSTWTSCFSCQQQLTPSADFVDGLNYRDIDQGESDHYPHPRFASRLKSAWVACKGLDQVASLHQAHALMRAGSPVKLNKTPLVAKLCQWTLDHLVRAVCSTPIHIPTTEISAKVLHVHF